MTSDRARGRQENATTGAESDVKCRDRQVTLGQIWMSLHKAENRVWKTL